MPKTHLLSESVEEYLEAIHRLGEDASGASTTSLARRLNVTPASVTGMLRRLRELGFISYHRYREIALTDEGQQHAHDLIRRHRLAERLLTDILKVPLSEVHDEACRLEHVVSPQLEQRISDALGAPEACPHGHPIELHAPDRTLSLLTAPLNVPLLVARLNNESSEVLRHLGEQGLLPGVEVVVRGRSTAAGTVVLESAGETRTLGLAIAETIRVHPPRGRRT